MSLLSPAIQHLYYYQTFYVLKQLQLHFWHIYFNILQNFWCYFHFQHLHYSCSYNFKIYCTTLSHIITSSQKLHYYTFNTYINTLSAPYWWLLGTPSGLSSLTLLRFQHLNSCYYPFNTYIHTVSEHAETFEPPQPQWNGFYVDQ